MNKGFSSVLNISRWVAALLVVVHHVRHLVLADLNDVANAGLLTKAFYFWTGLGHEAVVVFFVVSGLLVGALTLEKWRLGKANGVFDYLAHRFSRIYIVFIPALAVGYGLDYMGLLAFDNAQLYSNSYQYHTISLDTIIKDNLSIEVLLGNLFMLQKVCVSVLGSNGPLWSLAFEWWYYILWILCIAIIFMRGIRQWLSAALLIVLLAALPWEILLWMNIWLLGVATYYYGRSNWPKPSPWLSFGLFVVALVVSRQSTHYFNQVNTVFINPHFIRDFGLGLVFSVFLASCSQLSQPFRGDALHTKLAGFSYSLYLVHFPAMVFLVAASHQLLNSGFLLQPSFKAYSYFMLCVVVLCVYGYLFSLVTEKHTFKLVKLLKSIGVGRVWQV
ncbi:acyltransferase family protein [Methylomonas sp. AM2-LC]|uniref:acyltransferase family protein n=1 Tax=Methylomonas sp. AM2-LC TaxID=3153301 RepID=UPI003265601B